MRRQLTLLIETGQLVTGERLPSVRQLAGDLGLATGTVARAYRELGPRGSSLPGAGAAPGSLTDQARRARP